MERSDSNRSDTTTDGVDRIGQKVTVGDKKSAIAPPPESKTSCETPSSPPPSGRRNIKQCMTPESNTGGRAFGSPVIGKTLGLDLEGTLVWPAGDCVTFTDF